MEKTASFCTAVNCMDGRVQLPVIDYLRRRFSVEYVDSVTEPGPVLILAQKNDTEQARSILRRVDISINKHKSSAIAIAAHFDCAGNSAEESVQRNQLARAAQFLSSRYPGADILGLWVDSSWQVHEVCCVKAPVKT
jgi:hypothetical protein